MLNGIQYRIRQTRNIPYILPILRDGINLQYIFQYLESWVPIPKVLTGLAGRRFGPPAQQPTSMPLFEHKMTPKSLFLTLYRPPKVISQPLQTLQEKMGQLSPLLAVTSEIFGFTPPVTPKTLILGATNIQYIFQYLESCSPISNINT